VNLALFIICVGYGSYASFASLDRADDSICVDETERLVYQLTTHLYHINKLVSVAAQSDELFAAIEAAGAGDNRAMESAVGNLFFTKGGVWDTSMDINLVTLFYPNLSVAETWYYPSSVPGSEELKNRGQIDTTTWREVLSTKRSYDSPYFNPEIMRRFGTQQKWSNIISPSNSEDLFLYSFSPVTYQNGTGTNGGFIAIGRLLEGKLRSSAEGISACVTSYLSEGDKAMLSGEDKKALEDTPSRTLYTGVDAKKVVTVIHKNSWLDGNKNRFCPKSMTLIPNEKAVSCLSRSRTLH